MGKSKYKKILRKQKTLHNEALSKHYNTLTSEERRIVRTQLTIKQDGCCAICEKPEKEIDRQLAIDHCHATGHIRGLLCNSCNWMLGHAQDNVYILQGAIDYIKKSRNLPFV